MTQKPTFEQIIADILPGLVQLRRDIHAHPQVGLEETYAAEKIQQHLTAAGIEFVSGLAETGVVGYLHASDGCDKSPAIALRADIDALPITEQTALPYASQNANVMHACGHDGHIAMLLGAAKVLAVLRDDGRLPRGVKFVFQPAEEGLGGAKLMLDQGALSPDVGGIDPTSIFALHADPSRQLGQLALRSGPAMANVSNFCIRVIGIGGHGAKPLDAKNPIIPAAQLVTQLQAASTESFDSDLPTVMTVCCINGGAISNVIPDCVELQGTVRAFDDATSKLMHRRIAKISHATAAKFGCTVTAESNYGYPVTVNAPTATERLRSVAENVLGKSNVLSDELHTISEDFSYYAQQIPGCIAFLGTRPAEIFADCYPQLHSPEFDFNDDAIAKGVEILVSLVVTPE